MSQTQDSKDMGFNPLPENWEDGAFTDYLHLNFSLRYPAKPRWYEVPEEYVQVWNVTAVSDDEELYDPDEPAVDGAAEIGRCTVYVVPNVDLVNLWDVMDVSGADFVRYADALIAAGSPAKELGVRLHDKPAPSGDLFVLADITVLPRFRGHLAGHEILKGVLRTIGRNVSLALLQAAPALDEGSTEGTPAHEEARNALLRYWADFGFQQLIDDYLILEYDDLLAALMDEGEENSF